MKRQRPVGWGGRSVLASAITSILAGGASLTGTVYAQQTEPETAGLEEITVTGTRIRRDDFSSPNPVSTFGGDEMRNLGIVNVADIITQVPSNVSQFQPENTGGSAFFIGSTLANLRGLNPFFGTRTLTLVDSRRFVPTNQGGSVDLNMVPSILVDRMETVTGGASASYGSEAVSGVVNILLDKDLEGVRLEMDFSETGEGDGDASHVGIAGGTDLFDGRGHIVAGGEFQYQSAIRDCATARDWCGRSTDAFSNGEGGGFFDPIPNPHPYVPRIPGQPHNIIMSDLRTPTSINGLVFDPDPTPGVQRYQFNDAGTDIIPYDAGEFAWVSPPGPGVNVIGGEGRSINSELALLPNVDRETFFTHFRYDFSDRLTMYTEVSYANVESTNLQYAPGQTQRNICIQADNAYLQMGSAQMQSYVTGLAGNAPNTANCGNFALGTFTPGTVIAKDFVNQVDHSVRTDSETKRFVIGFEGDIGNAGNWTWDAYFQYGETERDQIGRDYQSNHRFNMALDSIIDPATGQPDCRVNVLGVIPAVTLPIGADPSLANGCVPLNPFGQDTLTEEAKNYVYGNLDEFNAIDQAVAEVSFSGEIWEGWGAGSLLMAGGVGYRDEELHNDAGPLPFAFRTDFNLQYGDEFGGRVEVEEAFVEFEMPLLANKPGADLWMVNAAFRTASYTNTGLENTTQQTADQDIDVWKISMVWDPVSWLRIRGTRSEDIRAAGFRELYYSQTIPAGGFFGSVTNPWLPDLGPFSQSDESVVILSGNPRLLPEVANTNTFGFVLSPGGRADGFQFSADYYEIELRDGIALGIAAEAISECFQLSTGAATPADLTAPVCDFMTFGPPTDPMNPFSNIVEARAPYFNSDPYEATGVDLSVSYLLSLDGGGSISTRLLATHAIDIIVESSGEIRDVAGQTGGDQGFLSDFATAPDWSGNLMVTYAKDAFAFTAQAQYTSDGKLNKQTPWVGPGEPGFDPNLTRTVTDNTVPSHITWNFSGSYDFQVGSLENLQLFATINNVFDKDPPYANGSTGGANPVFFDALGRQYRVGVRLNF